MPPQDGAQSISENVIPSVCSQSGRAVFSRWWGPAQM